jgi:hypothetical protein
MSHRAPRPVRDPVSVVVVVVVTLAVGCGDLSQDDLLFRAAIPSSQTLAVTPPGSEDGEATEGQGQALTAACGAVELRCDAAFIARSLNRRTFALLALVDRIAASAPTTRAPGRRVWGPAYDDERDATFRFEMTRDDDGATFAFCLHGAPGRVVTEGTVLGCDVAATDRFARVLQGSFAPASLAAASARQGAGTMEFDVAALAALGQDAGADARFARGIAFVFDNRADATDIHVELDGLTVDGGERGAVYDFERDAAGAGSFAFQFFADVVDGVRPRSALERVRLLARWQADRAGRAEGIVDNGDVATPRLVSQCWDRALQTTYARGVDGSASGDENRCAVDAAAVVPPS